VESAVAWKCALERRDGPSCLAFSRQNLPHQMRTPEQIAAIARGGYVLLDTASDKIDAILIGTGSELDLCVQAARTLAAEGHAIRVVSMPCAEAFDAQPLEYRESVLPRLVPQARRHRGRHRRLLAQVRGTGRRGHRHGYLRRVGTGQSPLPAPRIRHGPHPRRGARAAGEVT
jgi:transketolase